MKPRSVAKAIALGGTAVAVGLISSTPEGRKRDAGRFTGINVGRGPAADRVYSGITELGSLWAAGAAAATLALFGKRRAAARAFLASSVAWAGGQALKRLFLRPRPYEADPDGASLRIGKPNGSSWPSTHPAVLTSFVTVAGRELGLSGPARGALTALSNAVGISRVYLGVHYPSDVTSGVFLGRAVAEVFSSGR